MPSTNDWDPIVTPGNMADLPLIQEYGRDLETYTNHVLAMSVVPPAPPPPPPPTEMPTGGANNTLGFWAPITDHSVWELAQNPNADIKAKQISISYQLVDRLGNYIAPLMSSLVINNYGNAWDLYHHCQLIKPTGPAQGSNLFSLRVIQHLRYLLNDKPQEYLFDQCMVLKRINEVA